MRRRKEYTSIEYPRINKVKRPNIVHYKDVYVYDDNGKLTSIHCSTVRCYKPGKVK